MKILIVGAGIGGLSLAAFLRDSKIDYEIIEKASDWKHQGYSMILWSNGRNILKKLGLEEAFDKASTRIKNYLIYNGSGRLLRKYNLSDFYSSYGMALSLVDRGELHDWLLSKAGASKVFMNTNIDSISQNSDTVSVRFSSGESKDYDLVVGADGIHSKVRKLIFPEAKEKGNGWRVWYMWVENKYKTEAAATEYIEPSEFISIFDSGVKTLASVAAPNHHMAFDDPHGRIARLKKYFADENLLVPQIFDSLKDEEIVTADLIHVKLNKWHKGRVVLLGDAAHGFEPYAGIGGSMALEDGYVLAGELMQVNKDYPLSFALQNYERKRKIRVRLAYKLTQKMKGWASIKSKVLRRIVNMFLPYFPESFFVKDYQKLFNEEI